MGTRQKETTRYNKFVNQLLGIPIDDGLLTSQIHDPPPLPWPLCV